MKTKLLVLLLALLMLVSAFAGCSNATDNPEEGSTEQESDAESTAEDDALPPPDFDSIDMNCEFKVLQRDGAEKEEWEFEKEENPILNNALIEKIGYLEEKYNISFSYYRIALSDTAMIANSIQGGEQAYDFLSYPAYHSNTLAIKGLLHSLQTVDTIDTTQIWWNKELNDMLSYQGHNFFAVGSSNLSALWRASCVFVNKDIAEDRGYAMSDIYDMVNDHTWTIDKMLELATDVYVDADEIEGASAGDTFGISQTVCWYPTFYGAGLMFATKDSDGDFVVNSIDEKTVDIITKIITYVNDESICVPLGAGIDQFSQFTDGKALFLVEGINVSTKAKGSATDYGILPAPLGSTDQNRYYSFVHKTHNSTFSIPVDVDADKLSWIGMIIEEANYISRKEIWPAFYETLLKGQVAKDPESAEILDIVFDSMVIDPGIVYSAEFDNKIRSMVSTNQDSGIKSDLDTLTGVVQYDLDNIIKKYKEVIAKYKEQ
ncbi:MAG: hypothetical protein IJZ80_09705 [Clostridia bacterium]|nr:hypothetical protein [Clostridia bacterium]